jgi:hypothetical protein
MRNALKCVFEQYRSPLKAFKENDRVTGYPYLWGIPTLAGIGDIKARDQSGSEPSGTGLKAHHPSVRRSRDIAIAHFQNGARSMLNDVVSLRVAELTIESSKRVQDGIVGRRVADINHWLKEWQERWEAVRNAIDLIEGERGAEMQDLQIGDPPDAPAGEEG